MPSPIEKTQKERLLNVLQRNEFVRVKFIIEQLHIYQYNAVIWALRQDGWIIDAVAKKIPNPVNPCRLVKMRGYRLKGKRNAEDLFAVQAV